MHSFRRRLSRKAVASPCPLRPEEWLADRQARLEIRLRELGRAARMGTIPGGSIENGVLHIEKLEAAAPDGAENMVLDLYKEIPPSRITDLLLEVDAATGFCEAFTHLRTGAPCSDRIGLMNVILAEGINLGLRKMADATNTHTFWELTRIGRWHVEGEAYDRALAMVVEAQAALPMARFWGHGHLGFKRRPVLCRHRTRRGHEPGQRKIRQHSGPESV